MSRFSCISTNVLGGEQFFFRSKLTFRTHWDHFNLKVTVKEHISHLYLLYCVIFPDEKEYVVIVQLGNGSKSKFDNWHPITHLLWLLSAHILHYCVWRWRPFICIKVAPWARTPKTSPHPRTSWQFFFFCALEQAHCSHSQAEPVETHACTRHLLATILPCTFSNDYVKNKCFFWFLPFCSHSHQLPCF